MVLSPEGDPLASSGDSDDWAKAGRELLAAADTAAGEPVSQAHIGSEDGETFAVRDRGYTFVVAAERFALASLLFFDIRTVLRDLVNGPEAAS